MVGNIILSYALIFHPSRPRASIETCAQYCPSIQQFSSELISTGSELEQPGAKVASTDVIARSMTSKFPLPVNELWPHKPHNFLPAEIDA